MASRTWVLRRYEFAVSRRRSDAHASPNFHTGMPSFLALSARFARDAGAGKHDDANREDVEDLVVALERRGPRVTVPVGLEDDLRYLAGVSPAGGDALLRFRRADSKCVAAASTRARDA